MKRAVILGLIGICGGSPASADLLSDAGEGARADAHSERGVVEATAQHAPAGSVGVEAHSALFRDSPGLFEGLALPHNGGVARYAPASSISLSASVGETDFGYGVGAGVSVQVFGRPRAQIAMLARIERMWDDQEAFSLERILYETGAVATWCVDDGCHSHVSARALWRSYKVDTTVGFGSLEAGRVRLGASAVLRLSTHIKVVAEMTPLVVDLDTDGDARFFDTDGRSDTLRFGDVLTYGVRWYGYGFAVTAAANKDLRDLANPAETGFVGVAYRF